MKQTFVQTFIARRPINRSDVAILLHRMSQLLHKHADDLQPDPGIPGVPSTKSSDEHELNAFEGEILYISNHPYSGHDELRIRIVHKF